MSNHLRISFAEWLWRMSDENVPYQARSLAIHAVLFKITGNDDLARLSGMDSKGRAEKTFNKWKRFLAQNGWVLLSNIKGGRGMGIEVSPAYKETPVEFTDVSRRDPRRFNPRKNERRVEEDTEVFDPETGVISTETGVRLTPDVPSRARKENPSGLVINYNKNNYLPTTTVEQDAEHGGGFGAEFDELNGTVVDLVNFISKATNVTPDVAKNMLRNNIKAFGSEAMLEAYSSTIAEMAEGMVATPYKYLLGCAKQNKDRAAAKRATKADPVKQESKAERWSRMLADMEASK